MSFPQLLKIFVPLHTSHELMKILHWKLLDCTAERNFLHLSMAIFASPFSASMTIFFDFCFIFWVKLLYSTIGLSSTLSTVIFREISLSALVGCSNEMKNLIRKTQPRVIRKVLAGFSREVKKSTAVSRPDARSATIMLSKIIWNTEYL